MLANAKDIPAQHFPSEDLQLQHKICRNIHFLVGQEFEGHNRHYEKTKNGTLSKSFFDEMNLLSIDNMLEIIPDLNIIHDA